MLKKTIELLPVVHMNGGVDYTGPEWNEVVTLMEEYIDIMEWWMDPKSGNEKFVEMDRRRRRVHNELARAVIEFLVAKKMINKSPYSDEALEEGRMFVNQAVEWAYREIF